ncbi:MAG: transglutaminase family protein [Hyphomicrobiales bacterium]|nr:transglutaminase family protein [Hyphomicrobiales bacterium]
MDDLTESERRLYTAPAEYIDSDHPAIVAFAQARAAHLPNERARASVLYKAVRDEIRYNPYVDMGSLAVFRASDVLARGEGYCVGKAALYAAALRALAIPARAGFADVRNHLTTQKLRERMGGADTFYWHGFTQVFIDGEWRKATPTFNASLCEKLGVLPLDFDGRHDALLHPFDSEGRAFMVYQNDHGAFFDVPARFLVREMQACYPDLVATGRGGDMEREAMADRSA